MFLRCVPQSFRTISRGTRIPAPPSASTLKSQFESLTIHNGFTTASNNCMVAAADQKNDEADAKRLAPATSIEAGLHNALVQKQYEKADPVVPKLVGLYQPNPTARLSLFHEFLPSDGFTHFSDTTVLDILGYFRSSTSEARRVDPLALKHVLQERDHRHIQTAVADILVLQLQNLKVPDGPASIQYQPPNAVEEIFWLLLLLAEKRPEVAFPIFSTLVGKQFIPFELVQAIASSEPQGPQLVMLASLAKASFHWGWSPLVVESTKSLIQVEGASRSLISSLVADAVESLLGGNLPANTAHVDSCLVLIQAAHSQTPASDGAICRFYDMARECDCGPQAEALYHFTRSESVLAEHHYPAPQGYAIGWLMETLYKSGRHPHLCGVFAQEVVDTHIPLPLHCRPGFIAISASTGNVVLARALWERYTARKDKHGVVGDGRLLVALALASMTLIQRMEAEGTSAEKGEALYGLKPFLHRAVKAFLKFHHQMRRSSPQTLTQYAQVCFILGRYQEGVKIFRTLVRRKEAADASAIDFCVGILVEKDPEGAAKLICEMKTWKKRSFAPE